MHQPKDTDWLLTVKTDKHLYYFDYVTITHFNTIVLISWWVNRKIVEFYITKKLPFNRKICNHFLNYICISELSWNFWKLQMPRGCLFSFFGQSSRYASNEQPCLKQLECIRIFCFYLVCFTFSISYSVLPFHLVYVFQYLHLSFFFSFWCSFSSLNQAWQKNFCIHTYK